MITQEQLKREYYYFPESGMFVAKSMRSNSQDVLSGFKDNHNGGYSQVRIFGEVYLAHRLVFLYMKGFIPKEIDHSNGVPNDNRWSNLRSVTRSQNNQNQRRVRKGTSVFKGVTFYKAYNNWRASITYNGKFIHIGYYETESEASEAYQLKSKELFGEYSPYFN